MTIDIFQGKVEFNKQFKDLAKKYEEENPDVKINITSVLVVEQTTLAH